MSSSRTRLKNLLGVVPIILTSYWMESQITSIMIVHSTVCSGSDQRKHQSSASLAFVGNSPVINGFPAQRTSNAKIISIWWRHHSVTKMIHTDPRACIKHKTDSHGPLIFETKLAFDGFEIALGILLNTIRDIYNPKHGCCQILWKISLSQIRAIYKSIYIYIYH